MYFDDMPVGFTYETASRTLSAEAIKTFAAEWDAQPFHLDEEAAKASVYGGLIASGFHTILTALTLTLAAFDWSKSSMGSSGMENVRWILPVHAGDTLRVKAAVVGAKASRSKPDRGFVEVQYDIYNQKDEMVAAYRATHMLRRRPQAE